ncbi:MAG: hypothetical protein IKT53_09380 [Bacteroidaceae bacterium]|nr:hypothetical protein [Bacteroidaceae bacterium]
MKRRWIRKTKFFEDGGVLKLLLVFSFKRPPPTGTPSYPRGRAPYIDFQLFTFLLLKRRWIQKTKVFEDGGVLIPRSMGYCNREDDNALPLRGLPLQRGRVHSSMILSNLTPLPLKERLHCKLLLKKVSPSLELVFFRMGRS